MICNFKKAKFKSIYFRIKINAHNAHQLAGSFSLKAQGIKEQFHRPTVLKLPIAHQSQLKSF